METETKSNERKICISPKKRKPVHELYASKNIHEKKNTILRNIAEN